MITNPLDENKKRAAEEAKKEAKAFDERMRLQKEQARRLKTDVKKRELEEIKRKVALKTNEKNRLALELNNLKNKERMAEQSIRNSSRIKFGEEDILNKKQEKEKIRREVEQFETETEQKKRGGALKITQKQYEINSKKKELERLKQQMASITAELSKLEQELSPLKGPGASDTTTAGIESNRKIEAKETRLKAIKKEIKELEFEKSEIEQEIKTETEQKKRGGAQKILQKQNEVSTKKKELERLKQQMASITAELIKLEQELSPLKGPGASDTTKNELELTKKINREKEIERELETLERNKKLSQSQADSTKRTGAELKRKIEGEERRLAVAEQELQKLTTEQNRIEQEIRGL